MQTRAAVAFEAGGPLKIETVELEGPKESSADHHITHTMSLENINDGFELMHTGESIRSVVDD